MARRLTWAIAGILGVTVSALTAPPARACVVSPHVPPPNAPVVLPADEAAPALEVVDVKIERGIGPRCEAANSCAGIGKIFFGVRLTGTSRSPCAFAYALERASGSPPSGLALPPRVGVGCAAGATVGGAYLTWDDEARDEQDPFSLELRLAAVDGAGRRGPATTFRLAHDGAPALPPARCDAGADSSARSAEPVGGGGGCTSSGARPRAAGALALLPLVLLALFRRRRGDRV